MNFILNRMPDLFWMLILTSTFLISCTKDDPAQIPPFADAGYANGVFILNEGPFQIGTGTVSYLNRDGSSQEDNIYQKANNLVPLGNIVQSMNVDYYNGGNAFITVNNANKIEVVSLKTFQHVETIEDITSPRYIIFTPHAEAFVSCWDNTVKVIGLDNYEKIDEINVGTGPEKMLYSSVNEQIWILNQGGFSVDSSITIINAQDHSIINTLEVNAKPTGILKDKNDHVWVLCSGNGWNGFPGQDDTEGHLLCFDVESHNLLKDFPFPSTSEHPEKLVINGTGDVLYYIGIDGIYKFGIEDTILQTTPFIPRPQMFYGLGLDYLTNIIYASDPLDYVQDGLVYRYEANTGEVIDSLQAGIVPGEFYFPLNLVTTE